MYGRSLVPERIAGMDEAIRRMERRFQGISSADGFKKNGAPCSLQSAPFDSMACLFFLITIYQLNASPAFQSRPEPFS